MSIQRLKLTEEPARKIKGVGIRFGLRIQAGEIRNPAGWHVFGQQVFVLGTMLSQPIKARGHSANDGWAAKAWQRLWDDHTRAGCWDEDMPSRRASPW